ncbi:MAG: flagellar biosynthesis anti-sigma factor FlgM [Nitrospirae bacterium]|nr:flagellar biosynthesis anti-sigma factor FlgM [Nitrospirota bacterium]
MANDISRIGQAPPPPPVPPSGGGRKPPSTPPSGGSDSGDRVTRTTPDYTQKTNSIPEVRTDRVQEVRRQIDKGNYEVDSKEVADKLVRDTLKDLVAPDLASKVTGR